MKPFLLVLAGVSVVGIVTAERASCVKRAAFSSTNFENILTWETAAEIPPGTVFDVQYKQYGEKSWLSKRECQSITQLFCNLSRETENFREHFYGRVRARGCSSSWVRSERFEPRKETTIGAPQVEPIPRVRSIRFLIQPPLTPLRGEDGQQLTVEDISSKFGAVDYHLTIFNQRTQQQWTKNEHSKEFEVSNLEPDTEYNGTVYMCLLQRRSKAQVFWVKTLADKTWILYCLVALAFCAGLVFAASAYVIYKYIKQHRAQPRALDFRGIPSFQPLTLTVEHIIKPLSLSKPSLSIPEVQLAQMSQHLDWALQPPGPLGAYQQQADIPALKTDVSALKTDVATLQRDVLALQKDIPTLQKDVPALQTDVPALQRDIPALQTDVTALQREVPALQTDFPALQTDFPALQLPPEPCQGHIPAPSAYTPQRDGHSIPAAPGSSLALTYGLCVEGSEHQHSSQTDQELQEVSADCSVDGNLPIQGLGRSCSHWDYKEQQPLWDSSDRLESVVIQGSPGQPQLLLQSEMGNAERVSQLSLSLLEQGGCYTAQAELPLLLAAGKAAPGCAAEQELLAPLLLSVRTGNPPAEQHWVLPEPFPHKVQLPETAAMQMLPAGKELSCTELSLPPAQHTHTPLSLLFKDLDLKVQWDEEDSTECY